MAEIINGKAISEEVKAGVKTGVEELFDKTGVRACLSVILVGDDPASQVYVRNKKIACEACGIKSIEHRLPASATQDELLGIIAELNADPGVHGILCQLPVPKQIDENEVLLAIDPRKDVDGFHPMNVGKFMTLKSFEDIVERGVFLPCTPHGCIELLERSGVVLKGADAVVIGRSNIVGKPVAMMLLSKHATVTICHSRTKNISEIVKRADVVVAAVGIPGFVKGEWIKRGAAVIDVGMNRIDDPTASKGSRLVGDVEFDKAAEVAGCITPVPGGVGLMTVAMLMKNTLTSATCFARNKA